MVVGSPQLPRRVEPLSFAHAFRAVLVLDPFFVGGLPVTVPLPTPSAPIHQDIITLRDLGIKRFGRKCDGAETSGSIAFVQVGSAEVPETGASGNAPSGGDVWANTSLVDAIGAQAAATKDFVPGLGGGADRSPMSLQPSPSPAPTPAPLAEVAARAGVVPAVQFVVRDEEELEHFDKSAFPDTDDPTGDPAFVYRNHIVLYIVLGVAVAFALTSVFLFMSASAFGVPSTKLGSRCLGNAAVASGARCGNALQSGAIQAVVAGAGSAPRRQVEALAVCHAAEVAKRLPMASGYDCVLSRPLSSGGSLRLEGIVEPATTFGVNALAAPLTRQSCVIYSASVSRQVHDGIPPVPVAFASASVDFVIALVNAREVRIQLQGEDVSLFGICRGRCVERRPFARAADHWQDFVLTHQACAPGTASRTCSTLIADATPLEFQECALLAGSMVTVVGELHRSADGLLSLRPCPTSSYGWAPEAQASTSSSLSGASAGDAKAAAEATHEAIAKVIISDDPDLLTTPPPPFSLQTPPSASPLVPPPQALPASLFPLASRALPIDASDLS
mmetsp:Transcript_116825/g.330524  ORF Transcript_116825/g.330524 Transcript_116825/m.330524 type:complete len:560 (-) Transcript_116825:114-1793(-)